jgi:single-stranded-DNA-specific exonuclease
VSELARLYPHGKGNPLPLFAATNVKIAGQPRRVGAQGQHISFYVRQGDTTLKAIAFGMGGEFDITQQNGKPCSIAFTPKLSYWMEQESVELDVKDIKTCSE